jgi:hypothetical protein
MPFVLQRQYGKLLRLPNGNMMGECCCAEEPCICDPNPSINLTVTGASGTRQWCGKTWNLPADSGKTFEVCPTTYTRDKALVLQTVPYFSTVWREKWYHTQTGTGTASNRLAMYRRFLRYSYLYTTTSPFPTSTIKTVSVGFNNLRLHTQNGAFTTTTTYARRYGHYWDVVPPPPYGASASPNSILLGVLSTAYPEPTESNYRIPNGYFGSSTINGITYAWARGCGW